MTAKNGQIGGKKIAADIIKYSVFLHAKKNAN